MIIVSLNIRGIGGGTKASYLKHVIAKEGAEFVCLQETKTTNLSDNRCFVLWGDNNIGWLHNEGVNGAGSILSLWHKEASCYDRHVVGSDFIAIMGEHLKSNRSCVVLNVYAMCNISDKISL